MTDREPVLMLAARIPVTTAEGPGRRFAVWVQGCTLGCPSCCNPRMLSPRGGLATPVRTLVDELHRARDEHGLEGLTVLGGEPLQQISAVTALCEAAAALGLGVLVFSGYRLAEAHARPGFSALWQSIDTLVDGRYDAQQPEPSANEGGRRFIGSRNQALHHRTDRYCDLTLWQGPPRVEAHVGEDGELVLNGEPEALERLLKALGTKAVRSRALTSVG